MFYIIVFYIEYINEDKKAILITIVLLKIVEINWCHDFEKKELVLASLYQFTQDKIAGCAFLFVHKVSTVVV